MSNDILLGLLIGAVIAAGFLWFLQKRREKDGLPDAIAKHLAELIPQYMKDAREQLIQLAEERLGGERKAISTDLENKRKTIERMVDTIQKELRDTDRTSQSILQQMKDHQKITQELSVTTEGLKKVLTNNQLRGQFGEQVAEDLLKMVGFVKGVDFEFNKAQDFDQLVLILLFFFLIKQKLMLMLNFHMQIFREPQKQKIELVNSNF